MSWGEAADEVAPLRAFAHPLRLRMLSLLTGTALSAAEVARELELTHANASYHLRLLHRAGLVVVEGEESVRGGRAKRYRYVGHRAGAEGRLTKDDAGRAALWQSLADELVRRSRLQRASAQQHLVDAELWVDPQEWARALAAVQAAATRLHDVARPPRTPGATHVSLTSAMFEMAEPGDPVQRAVPDGTSAPTERG